MSITNTITSTIQELDAAGATLARRVAPASDTAATVGEFRSGNLIDTNQATISLPVAQVRQVWVRNIHASARITVVWTPNGGAQATIIVLGPNDQVMLWHTTTNAAYGISSLKLTSDTANAPYELYLGG